jgi:hypothetical protein
MHTVILANNFDILDGTAEITVPWVLDGNDYSVLCGYLFGIVEVDEIGADAVRM